MNIKQTSLGLLGVSVGMGAILSIAPISPVQAARLDKDIVNANNQVIGRLTMEWDDSSVTNNLLEGFESLTSFDLTNYNGMDYDLDFAKSADFHSFSFNVNSGWLDMFAYNRSRDTSTRKYGFEIMSENPDFPLVSSSIPASNIPNDQTVGLTALDQALADNTYSAQLNLGESTTLEENTSFKPPIPQDPQTVPENSLTTALLIIAGLVFLSPHKIF